MGCIQITNLPLQQPKSNILRVLRLHLTHSRTLENGEFQQYISILILFCQTINKQLSVLVK